MRPKSNTVDIFGRMLQMKLPARVPHVEGTMHLSADIARPVALQKKKILDSFGRRKNPRSVFVEVCRLDCETNEV